MGNGRRWHTGRHCGTNGGVGSQGERVEPGRKGSQGERRAREKGGLG